MKLKWEHAWLKPRIALPVAAAIVVVQIPFLHAALRGAAPVTAAVPYEDKFDRATLGEFTAGYALSPAIRIHWIENGDHSFRPLRKALGNERENVAAATAEVLAFIGSL